jgi:hypothetical protein
MSPLSTARKLGVVAKVASQQARRSRTLGAVWGGVRATGRSTGKVVHQLWLEVIGALFLAMAGMGGFSGVREYLKFRAGQTSVGHVAIAACFTVAFAWFGISSFLRAGKSKSTQR